MPTDERPMDTGDGKPSRKGFSEDGRGGTEPTPGMRLGARYVYYRLYTKDGPLESNNRIYSNDHFISRIVSSSVRPPHTAASLVRHLCKIEGLAPQNCLLFQSLSEKTALDDSVRLSLKGTTGPGASDQDAMALVIDKRAAETRSRVTSAVEPRELLERNYEQRYVYYCVYDDDGEIASKTCFDENNPSLGRVDTLSVPPPHNVSSLKNRIIKSEDLSGNNVQLFEDEGSDSAMNDSDALTLSDTFPGSIEDQPIALTYESGTTNGSADNEDPNEIRIRELEEALVQIKKEFEEANRTYAHELAEVRDGWRKEEETHARELEESNRTHAHGLAEMRERWKNEKETHARELAEVRERWKKEEETHTRELEEANQTHTRELAEVREGWRKAKEKHEREIHEALSMIVQWKVPSTFTKKLKAKDYSNWSKDTRWHSMKTGEIFHTDGISRNEKYNNGYEYACYLAANSFGKLAFLGKDYTDFF